MVEQAQRTVATGKAEEAAKPAAVPLRQQIAARFAQLFSRGALGTMLAISLVLNAGVVAYLRLHKPARVVESGSPEIELGSFIFRGSDTGNAPVAGARFSLCISLLDGAERVAREHLAASRHRVQQAVEELLRTAHSGDFEDPSLSGLKRQLQEQINGVLGMRAISQVIITNLVLDRAHPSPGGKTRTAGPASVPESPPSS